MKERTSRSPDLFDQLVTAIEGCRRRGFQIENLKESAALEEQEADWLEKEQEKHRRAFEKRELRRT